MIFYKNMLISTILSVVLLLGITGYIMYTSKNVQIFPATINDCPDYYDINASNVCVANANVWDTTNQDFIDNKCNTIDFINGTYTSGSTSIKYNTAGKSASSGICGKKLMAQQCKITWDGITNDTSICV
jgi:hypothetical protein